MTIVAPLHFFDEQASVFAGVDVCAEAALRLPAGTRRPVFEDDMWNFTEVIGLLTQMPLVNRRFDFTAIVDDRWCLVAKELVIALLAPRHQAVAVLPRAYRTALHLNTARGRLAELTRWLNWLTTQGVTSLGQVDAEYCEAYLAHRRYVRDDHGTLIGGRSPATRRAAAQIIVDLVNYRELFTADRFDASLRPWSGASPSAVAEMRSGRDGNKTPPVEDRVLQPMLAAALYLTGTLGPQVAELAGDARKATSTSRRLPRPTLVPSEEITAVLDRHVEDHVPLPLLPLHDQRARLGDGWAPDDPLLTVSLNALANEAGVRQFRRGWLDSLRGPIEATLGEVGTAKPWGRDACSVPTANGDAHLTWTLPLHGSEVVALAGVVRTACIAVIAAVSGMRSSEIMEMQVGCRRPVQELSPDLARYRLASKVVKGQPLGGTKEEWVVVEPVYLAAGLAEELHDDREHGAPLFGRFSFPVRYRWFRNWVNSPAGSRLGLDPIPEEPVSLRALRRTLALELAYRPGGLLAAKIHLKHVSVATTEGYASRPGGAQAELLAEVNSHESERNLGLVLAEFRRYQQGILPAGPGARELTQFFAGVDTQLNPASPEAPKVHHNDREVLNLLTKRADTLHLGIASYCWFTDPSRALCLKLAGTPDTSAPLAGMCDSARCPQATHHPCHRPIWADHAKQGSSDVSGGALSWWNARKATSILGCSGAQKHYRRQEMRDDR